MFCGSDYQRTWVVGDSIVRRAGETGHQLTSGGETKWLGIGGARSAGLASRMKHYLQRNPAPTTVIVHLGCNDIFSRPLKEVMECIRQNFSELGKLLPQARIIWSSILPRLIYYGEHRKGPGKDFQWNLDNVGRQYCIRELGGCAISHKDFSALTHTIYSSKMLSIIPTAETGYIGKILRMHYVFQRQPRVRLLSTYMVKK